MFHLAALASVARSWRSPGETLVTNVQVTVNLLEAVRTGAPEAGVVVASSGAACDLLAGQYADVFGIRIVRTRAFNHAGPGQSDDYVVGTLTRQVAEAEAAGTAEVVLRTGNPDSARDFTDVRDVVRAYRAAAELPAGVYNLCSGRATACVISWSSCVAPPRSQCATRSTPTACAPTTCRSCAARRSACGPPAAGDPRFRWSGRWPTRRRFGGANWVGER